MFKVFTVARENFFRSRLAQEKVQMVASESAAIVKAYMECLRYLLQQNMADDSITEFLVQDQVAKL